MAIVTCEHHSGMGLCPQCVRELDQEDQRRRDHRPAALSDNANLLRRAADVLQAAGEPSLAEQIRMKIPRA